MDSCLDLDVNCPASFDQIHWQQKNDQDYLHYLPLHLLVAVVESGIVVE